MSPKIEGMDAPPSEPRMEQKRGRRHAYVWLNRMKWRSKVRFNTSIWDPERRRPAGLDRRTTSFEITSNHTTPLSGGTELIRSAKRLRSPSRGTRCSMHETEDDESVGVPRPPGGRVTTLSNPNGVLTGYLRRVGEVMIAVDETLVMPFGRLAPIERHVVNVELESSDVQILSGTRSSLRPPRPRYLLLTDAGPLELDVQDGAASTHRATAFCLTIGVDDAGTLD